MTPYVIHLFMWGYQAHYRALLESRAKAVFKNLGIDVAPKVLLVGALGPDKTNANPVCVEPEDGEWPLMLFTGLPDSIEIIVQGHPLQNVLYGDEPSMHDKPEDIRRDSVTKAVRESLSPYDVENSVRSFCGGAYPVGDYYVVPVIQVPELVFQQFPPLKETVTDNPWANRGYRSFVHACMKTLLTEATEELQGNRPTPARSPG